MAILDYGIVLLAYLFGSVSTAIIVCRAMGLPDPRTQGSGNPGATNVLRLGGKKAAALTLVGDLLKGLVPVLIARLLTQEEAVLVAAGLAAFLGHLYPLFFRFQGGKGVATAMGVLLGLSWPVALAAAGIWLVMAKVFRISSLSALTAAVLAPFLMWGLDGRTPFIAMSMIISALLLWRHRSNIQNLVAGTEGRIESR